MPPSPPLDREKEVWHLYNIDIKEFWSAEICTFGRLQWLILEEYRQGLQLKNTWGKKKKNLWLMMMDNGQFW